MADAESLGVRYRYYDGSSPDSFTIFDIAGDVARDDAVAGLFEPNAFPVVKVTKCGVWVDSWGRRHFIRDGEGKRFAYATKEAARTSFILRKLKQIEICEDRIVTARASLAAIGWTEAQGRPA